jgi:hypothetical protein
MKKIYFLLLFVATWALCTANSAEQKNMLRIADKSIEKVQRAIKTNADNVPLKSAMAQNHLDSITLDNGSKGLFFYNENDQLTDYKGYVISHDGTSKLVEHQQFEYDVAGSVTLFVQKFNDIIDGWKILEKIETQYDASGNIVSEVYWSYDYGEAEYPYENTDCMWKR